MPPLDPSGQQPEDHSWGEDRIKINVSSYGSVLSLED